MAEKEYYLTDVFAEGPYAGNRLATIIDASDLSSTEMQRIALAFNFAETTFICGGNSEDGFDVRIFTPAAEIPPQVAHWRAVYCIQSDTPRHVCGSQTLPDSRVFSKPPCTLEQTHQE